MSQHPEDPAEDATPDAAAPPEGPPRGTARLLLLVAGVVVVAQAAVLLTIAFLEVASIESDRVGLGASTAVFMGALGLLLLVALVQVLRGRTWPRGFLVFAQLLCLVLSFNFRGDAGWITPTMAGGAAVALACLLSPPVTQALGGHEPV